jgi:hypothetical protein
MFLAISVPPLRTTRCGRNDVASSSTQGYIEDIASCDSVLQTVCFAVGVIEADLLAFRIVIVVFDAPVLALVERRDGVGVPATFHTGGWDGAVHCGG